MEKKQHDIVDESQSFRVSTPIEASSQEPDTSRAGHILRWSQWQEGAVTGELGGPGKIGVDTDSAYMERAATGKLSVGGNVLCAG